jgi:2-polyprenyl-6-methoxyphenol hydroxylase-like FAD-dependent oxidoreductase
LNGLTHSQIRQAAADVVAPVRPGYSRDVRAIVIGAGIGGLSAALALRNAGIDATVFERMPELHEVGSGLTLWVNAMRALDEIGMADAVRERGAVVDQIENRSAEGRLLNRLPIAEVAEKRGAPSVSIHRAVLQQTLAEHLPEGALRLGMDCVGFDQAGDGVTVRFADGSEERADVLVGADGITSTVRGLLFERPQPRYSGYTCWRSAATLDHDLLRPTVYTQLYGKSSTFGIFPIEPGRWSWYGTKITAPGGAGRKSGAEWKREALEQFARWYEPVRAVIEATPEDEFIRQDINDLKPIEVWTKGRVALLGDAAHATTPTLGQGGCMAIEDGVVVARNLSGNGDIPAALEEYATARKVRANGIVRQARRHGALYHAANPMLALARGVMLRGPVRIAMREVDKLIGFKA